MKADRSPEKKLDALDRALGRLNPSIEDMESARERVRRALVDSRTETTLEFPLDARPLSVWNLRLPFFVAAAAAIMVVFVLKGGFQKTAIDARAVVESAEGTLYREKLKTGETLRSERGAVLALADGSHVEMRAQSELELQTADDGVRIRLSNGSVIVSAAKQGAGHLYVQTRELTVSVVGTVFFVTAEETGSRVAVIQGEVDVQQGNTVKKLLPGEQVATNPAMPSVPVAKEISWSHSAQEHLALLQQATAEPSQRSPAAPAAGQLEFATVSIIQNAPGAFMATNSLGLACRGIDGVERVSLVLSRPADESLTAPPGGCEGRSIFFSTMLELAYGAPPQNVSGGPDWARWSPGLIIESGRGTLVGLPMLARSGAISWPTASSFKVEALAANPSTTTREQLKQMLQKMLADRFKLKFHRETQEVPGYALIVAKDGPKLRAITGDYEESLVLNKGKSTLDKLAQSLSRVISAPILDKTGLAGPYEYEFYLLSRPGEVVRRGLGPGQRGSDPPVSRDRVTSTSAALQNQLGLQLQPERAVPVEFFVIDQVEEPPN